MLLCNFSVHIRPYNNWRHGRSIPFGASTSGLGALESIALQWRNSGGGCQSQCPLTFLTGKFLMTYQEKRGKAKRKNGEEKENCKREGWKLKMEEGKVTKWVEDLFFFFFKFYLAFHFSKPLKFVLGWPKWEFSTWKKHIKPGKNYFAPSEKYSSYASTAIL